jgi:hypothetical protein
MLREIKQVSQKSGEPRRCWFSGTSMDLFVWLNQDEEVVSYQFTYDKPHTEKALTWKKGEGFLHFDVDDGSRPGKHPGSPMLNRDGKIKASKVIELLHKNSGDLQPFLKKFIISSIENYLK